MTFNDHEDSTKSYAYAREFNHPVIHADFVPPAEEIKAAYDEGEVLPVELHDGSRILLRKVEKDFKRRQPRRQRSSTLRDAAARGRDRHGAALHQRGRARHARRQRHGRGAAEPAAVRSAVPRGGEPRELLQERFR